VIFLFSNIFYTKKRLAIKRLKLKENIEK